MMIMVSRTIWNREACIAKIKAAEEAGEPMDSFFGRLNKWYEDNVFIDSKWAQGCHEAICDAWDYLHPPQPRPVVVDIFGGLE